MIALAFAMGRNMTSNTPALVIDTSRPIAPLASAKFIVPQQAREAYFAQLTEFAAANGFRIRIAKKDASRNWFSTDMLRDDVVVTGDNIADSGKFSIKFLPAIGKPRSSDVAVALLSDLQSRLAHVPGLEKVEPSR